MKTTDNEKKVDADIAKLQTLTDRLLTEAGESSSRSCFVAPDRFIEVAELEVLTYETLGQHVRDYTTTNEFADKFGTWVFTEFGDGYWVFVQISDEAITSDDVKSGQQFMLE